MPLLSLIETTPIELNAHDGLIGMYKLSPFVWREGDHFRVAIRAVNHAENPEDKISRIYFGRSADGKSFTMEPAPGIAPTPGPDSLGCEDPTVYLTEDQVHVLYSGWNGEISVMLRARGRNTAELKKIGPVLPGFDQFRMSKEAVVIPHRDGVRLLFEYATGGASRIGGAMAKSIEGPFSFGLSPIGIREDHWDSWHLSPGDFTDWNGHRLLIYNGSDRDARWRIGWAELDEAGLHIIGRSEEPLIAPFDLSGDDTDIAFAASCLVVHDELWIYFSIADRYLHRARVKMGNS